jgi:hypothetical protein
MSDDLISRSALTKSMFQYVRGEKTIGQIIDEQPVAYDVEKVLKELKDEKTESYYKSVDGDVFSTGRNSAYQKAIEIVKRGGIGDVKSD